MQLETVGEIVRVLRSRLGLEQVELARACGWRDASAVSRIETDRVHPTRRTLLKLAENLADPAVTGTPAEIRAWLFLAAGVLPTAREIEELADRIPPIESYPQPAAVMDFGWHLWRANNLMRRGVGLPERYVGRNYVEMFFEPGGSIRTHFGEAWEPVAGVLIAEFRRDTIRRTDQRWYTKLLAKLRDLPDFQRIWDAQTPQIKEDIFNWLQTSALGGTIGAVRSHLTADPRLTIGQLIPEDADGRDSMVKFGGLPA
ncbi:MAG: MmyB family transcriptional regulator [Actinomycetota bacterium]